MFKKLTLLDVVCSVIKSFEKDLVDFNYRYFNSKEDLDNLDLIDNDQALSLLSGNLIKYVHSIPNVNVFDLTKCYRFNGVVDQHSDTKTITVTGVKYKDVTCEFFDIYSLVFVTINDNLESFKLEFSYKDKNDEQKLNFRLITRINGEISLEFFNNNLERRLLINNVLQSLSLIEKFEFNKQIVFSLGGHLTHMKEL